MTYYTHRENDFARLHPAFWGEGIRCTYREAFATTTLTADNSPTYPVISDSITQGQPHLHYQVLYPFSSISYECMTIPNFFHACLVQLFLGIYPVDWYLLYYFFALRFGGGGAISCVHILGFLYARHLRDPFLIPSFGLALMPCFWEWRKVLFVQE